MTENEIRDLERRTRRYFYDDGFVEIAVGLLFVLLGGYFLAGVALPADSPVKTWLDASLVLVIAAGMFLVGRLVRFLKQRITYPRTGYVEYKKKDTRPGRSLGAALSGGVIAAALAAFFTVSPSGMAWLPAINGVLLAVACHLFARRSEVGRFHILAAASAIIGLGVALAGFGDIQGVSLYYAGFGAAVLLSGLAAFGLYLRRSRTEAEGGHGR